MGHEFRRAEPRDQNEMKDIKGESWIRRSNNSAPKTARSIPSANDMPTNNQSEEGAAEI